MLNIFLIVSGLIVLAIIVSIIILFVKVNEHSDCQVCKDGKDGKDGKDINPKDLNDVKDALNKLNSNITKVSDDFNSNLTKLSDDFNNYKNDNDIDITSIKNYINNTVFPEIDNLVKKTKQGVFDIGNFKFTSSPDELILTNTNNSSSGNALRFRIPVGQEGQPSGDNRIDIIASSGFNNQYDTSRWIINSVAENINQNAYQSPSSYTPLGIFRRVPVPCNTDKQPCAFNQSN